MDAAAVVEVFGPGGDPGVDLVAGGESTSQHTAARPIDTVPFTARM